MKTPRNVTGKELAQALEVLGYQFVRQTGSHIRLTRFTDKTAHHITVPAHDPIKTGTLNAILKDVALACNLTKTELIEKLDI